MVLTGEQVEKVRRMHESGSTRSAIMRELRLDDHLYAEVCRQANLAERHGGRSSKEDREGKAAGLLPTLQCR